MSDIGVVKFVAAVGLHFPRPKFGGDDEGQETMWMTSMMRTLARYDDAVLSEAAGRIIATRNPKRDGKYFPVPSECTAACELACRTVNANSTPLLKGPNPNEWSDERIELAFDLMKGPLGKQAVREGWLMVLYQFCRETMRLPNTDEVAKCKAKQRAFEETYQKCANGDAGDLSHVLAKFGRTMKDKAEQDWARRVA